MKNQNPLEWLALCAGGVYLSDLRPITRTTALRKAIIQALGQVPQGRWTDQQWSDTAAYLLGRHCPCEEEAKIIDYLKTRI